MFITKYWGLFREGLKAKSEVKQLMEKKSGWKTSEFWISIATIVGSLFAAGGAFLPPQTVAMIITAVSCVYIIARSVVKLTPNPNDDIVVEKIGAILKEKFGIKEDAKFNP
jgi:hypothetical protein